MSYGRILGKQNLKNLNGHLASFLYIKDSSAGVSWSLALFVEDIPEPKPYDIPSEGYPKSFF